MTSNTAYELVYSALGEMREAFHKDGRIDDSNAKLDEVAKIFATYLAYKKGQLAQFPSEFSDNLVDELSTAFSVASHSPDYTTNEGVSIFGEHPRLILRAADRMLAVKLVHVVRQAVDSAFEMRQRDESFDVLNEAFGHFIRDNFRSNIEDAQYMTPPEVVRFVVDWAYKETSSDNTSISSRPMVVMDPTCGVGSFLTAFYDRVRQSSNGAEHVPVRLIGQDKVDRMVRLTALNMALFHVGTHVVTTGNSLAIGSALDSYNGQVDLIITNPPFGARFSSSEVKTRFGRNTPYFSSIVGNAANIDSELLFIDRAMALLKPGGRLFIVIPDGVVSSKGAASLLRRHLSGVSTLRAVVELPTTTFAQAGTRTRTAVLYLQKNISGAGNSGGGAIMAVSQDLGFHVASRKGVQVKISSGHNDLGLIGAALAEADESLDCIAPSIIMSSPSVVRVPLSYLSDASWSASDWTADRLNLLSTFESSSEYEVRNLGDMVELLSDSRRTERPADSVPYISVLHIIGEGLIDLKSISQYAPKTPGIPVYPGELMFSRLNPHITRAAIAPELAPKMHCSTEFEIMRPLSGTNLYEIMYLIYSQSFIRQVADMTSGTSSSHNRIRPEQLKNIKFAVPKSGTKARHEFDACIGRYAESIQSIEASTRRMAQERSLEHQLFVH